VLNRFSTLVIASALFALFQFGGVVSALSDKALDLLFLQRGPVEPSQEIIIIGVDESSLANISAWPFQRKYHAALLKKLKKAKVIGFDILFSESTDQDNIFSDAIKISPPVVLAAANNFHHRILYPASSLKNYFRIGHIEILLGQDGVVRKAGAFHRAGPRVFPAFSLAMLEAAGIARQFPPSDIPVLINHYGPEGTFLNLSYFDVLKGAYPEDFFKDRYILIGAEALGIGDSHITPFSRQYPTPGVEIQATILNNLLDNSWLHPLPMASRLFMVMIAFFCLFVWPTRREKWNLISNLLLAFLITGCSVVLFQRSLFMDPAQPLFFLVATFLVHLVAERIWTARKIFSEMSRIDQQLETRLKNVYTNIPSQFFNRQPLPISGGTRCHLTHLQAGVKALSLQHHFIENLLREKLPPLILWDKHNGMVILANTMFNMFWDKYAPEHTALPSIDEFATLLKNMPPENQQGQLDIKMFLEENRTPAVDIRMNAGGQRKYFRISIHPVTAEDIAFRGVLAILTDITEIKELEQLKDEIVSIVSHELKLPLTVILGYGEILTDTLQGTEKQYIEKICTQAQRLNRLIEDFLDIARLEHGRQKIRRLPLDLIRLVKEAVNAVSIPAEKKSIQLVQKVPYRVTPIIGDLTLLLQAVINLLDNAIKFSPSGTEITIKLIEEEKQFVLCVIDQGPGIPPDSQRKIFDKFNRGSQTPEEDGFGLGLNFVLEVVQKHGGEITLQPESGPGAAFCMTLPKNNPGDLIK